MSKDRWKIAPDLRGFRSAEGWRAVVSDKRGWWWLTEADGKTIIAGPGSEPQVFGVPDEIAEHEFDR